MPINFTIHKKDINEEKDWGYLDSDMNYTPWNNYIPHEIRVDKL